jgi:hypothetical protein
MPLRFVAFILRFYRYDEYVTEFKEKHVQTVQY